MSSSGLIYAFIVGGWAVYLVPMWLRREDELNKARQTQRYTTAIKVLSHKDSFERKLEAAAEQEQARELPMAAGQAGPAPASGQRTLERVRAKERNRESEIAEGSRGATGHEAARGQARPARAGSVPAAGPRRGSAARPVTASVAPRSAPPAGLGPRSGLRARRRRVVGALFALTSLGAIVSADLGMSYVWVMLLPAAALSGYIAWVRKDERARAEQRARRRAVAAKAASEAERRRVESEREQEEELRLEREELARRSTVARRRVAAARSRADRRTTPGTANGSGAGSGSGSGFGSGTGSGNGAGNGNGLAPGTPRGGRPDQGDLPRAANG